MRLFTTAEAQQAYGIPAITLARLCRAGKFADAHQIGGKWRIPTSSIEAMVDTFPNNRITSGHLNGNVGLAIGHGAQSIVLNYQEVRPQIVSHTTLAAAEDKLTQLPIDHIPPIAALPPCSQPVYAPNPFFVGREAT